MLQIALIEGVNGGIIDEGETDLGLGFVFAVHYGTDDFAHTAAVDSDDLLRTGNRDAAHDRSQKKIYQGVYILLYGLMTNTFSLPVATSQILTV